MADGEQMLGLLAPCARRVARNRIRFALYKFETFMSVQLTEDDASKKAFFDQSPLFALMATSFFGGDVVAGWGVDRRTADIWEAFCRDLDVMGPECWDSNGTPVGTSVFNALAQFVCIPVERVAARGGVAAERDDARAAEAARHASDIIMDSTLAPSRCCSTVDALVGALLCSYYGREQLCSWRVSERTVDKWDSVCTILALDDTSWVDTELSVVELARVSRLLPIVSSYCS